MTSGFLQRVERAYFRVLEAPPGTREEELAAACGGDADVEREVRAMLAQSPSTAGFLDQPALGRDFVLLATPVSEADLRDDLVGTHVGPYRIVRRIASGGMGTVYDALRDDEHLTQRVAIKVVKRGMDSEDIVRRFRAERQTLAGLSHANIARLLDAGMTRDGRPYLAMEFVEGEPIDRYCDAHAMPTNDRVRLFRAACEAVRAAHQSLVIHRDLKPSNILVTHDGTPKLLDFGIAKVLTPTNGATMTLAEDRRLTPEYASPEQVRGDVITTTSDVYSLGVILYELLAGHPPYRFATRSIEEVVRVVCETSPLPPSQAIDRTYSDADPDTGEPTTVTALTISRTREGTPDRLRRRLRGDLDTIVLTAMHRDPARRYPSVEALIEDLDRYLGEMPIRAHKDTLAYRTSKFIRRNPLATVLGSLACVFLVGGGAGVSCQAQRASRQRDDAYLARDQSERVADFMVNMMSAADPENLGAGITPQDMVHWAADQATQEVTDPLVRAAVQSAVGRAYTALGEYAKARETLEDAYAVRTRLLPEGHHDIAESLLDLGTLNFRTGNYEDAERCFRTSLEMHRRSRGPANWDTGRALNDLGSTLRALGRTEEALRTHQEALAVRRSQAGPGGEDLEVAESLNNIGAVYRQMGRNEEAEASVRESLAIRERLLKPDHPRVLQSRYNIATILLARGEAQQAEPLFQATLEGYRKTYPAGHTYIAIALQGLGGCHLRLAKPELAIEEFREALAIRTATLAPDDPALAIAQASLGRAYFAAGRTKEAERELVAALDRVGGARAGADRRFLNPVNDLIRLYEESGRPEQAAAYRKHLPGG